MRLRAKGRAGEWLYMDFPSIKKAKEMNPYLYDWEVCER